MTTFVGTFGFSGFFPVAPATFASLVFVLIYTFVPGGAWLAHPGVALATLIVSIPVSSRLENRHGHDARCIVIDEIVGLQFIFAWAQPTTVGVVLAFLLFRFFDIVKPFPGGRAQRLPGGLGVVMDDVVAGLYARAALLVIGLAYPAARGFGF